MNDLADGLVELLDSNDEACGSPQFVLIEGKKKRAIIEDISNEEVIVAGGNAESGGFRAKCLKSEFADSPEQGDEIRKGADGRKLSILSFNEINDAEYLITAGDPATE